MEKNRQFEDDSGALTVISVSPDNKDLLLKRYCGNFEWKTEIPQSVRLATDIEFKLSGKVETDMWPKQKTFWLYMLSKLLVCYCQT